MEGQERHGGFRTGREVRPACLMSYFLGLGFICILYRKESPNKKFLLQTNRSRKVWDFRTTS